MKDSFDICLASNDLFSMQAGICMLSILENNPDAGIVFWVLESSISSSNKANLIQIAARYAAIVHFIPMKDRLGQLKSSDCLAYGDMKGFDTYSRLWLADILPLEIKKILYLDCDIVVNSSLQFLFDFNIEEWACAAVYDIRSSRYNRIIQLSPDEAYYNAGVLLINVDFWRFNSVKSLFLAYLKKNKPYFNDQDAINVILNKKIKTLPISYNMIAPFRIYSPRQIKMITRRNVFYSNIEISNAQKQPAIIHYTYSFLSRPWEKKCIDPNKSRWLYFFSKSPWNSVRLEPKKISFLKNLNRIVWLFFPKIISALRFRNGEDRIVFRCQNVKKDFYKIGGYIGKK